MDDLRVLTAIYFNSDFSIGDDAHVGCRLMADCFERDPPSIDRQWRNIAAIAKGNRGYNAGQLVKDAVLDYLNLPTGSKEVARSIAEDNGWEIDDLITGNWQPEEELADQATPAATPLGQLSEGLSNMCGELNERRFKTGSQGFFAHGKIQVNADVRYQSQITVVLIGSKKDPNMKVLATSKEVASAIRSILGELEKRTFKTGSTGFTWAGKVMANSQKFWVNVQTVRIGSK